RRAQASAEAVHQDLKRLSRSNERASPKQIAELTARAADTEEILAEFVTEAERAATRTPVTAKAAARNKVRLTATQTLLLIFIALYWIVALAGPAYTAALDRARAMRTIGHTPISLGTTQPPK